MLPPLLSLMTWVLLAGCGPDPRARAELERQARQQRLLSLCQQQQQRLAPLLARFEAAQRRLTAIHAIAYNPMPGPKPLDPEEQRRLTIEDQQTEQDLHDREVEIWSQAEARRRERWESAQAVRERSAREALEAAAQPLRQLHPGLVLAGSPPRLDGAEVVRFRDCSPERFR